MVLVDNVSTLNVFPFKIALNIGLDLGTIIPSPLTIKAYNNTLRNVVGTYKATCKIGPLDSNVEFHVMDITPSYNLLLGKAWPHPIGAVSLYLAPIDEDSMERWNCDNTWGWRDSSTYL